jgi:hypothetical protein
MAPPSGMVDGDPPGPRSRHLPRCPDGRVSPSGTEARRSVMPSRDRDGEAEAALGTAGKTESRSFLQEGTWPVQAASSIARSPASVRPSASRSPAGVSHAASSMARSAGPTVPSPSRSGPRIGVRRTSWPTGRSSTRSGCSPRAQGSPPRRRRARSAACRRGRSGSWPRWSSRSQRTTSRSRASTTPGTCCSRRSRGCARKVPRLVQVDRVDPLPVPRRRRHGRDRHRVEVEDLVSRDDLPRVVHVGGRVDAVPRDRPEGREPPRRRVRTEPEPARSRRVRAA